MTSDCKWHRLLSGRRKLEFAVFRWVQAQSAQRSFVARRLDLPLAASGPTARDAMKGLKHAVDQYLKYCTGTMLGGWGRLQNAAIAAGNLTELETLSNAN